MLYGDELRANEELWDAWIQIGKEISRVSLQL